MDTLEIRKRLANRTFEEKIAEQRKEAAERIKRKYPAECAANQNHYCEYPCDFWVIEVNIDTMAKRGSCVYDLAPITSMCLPCPYYRAQRTTGGFCQW